MTTINVKDAAGTTVAIEKPLIPGRAAAVASRPVVLSTEDKAALDALVEPKAETVTAGSVGVASAELLAADASRVLVLIQNVSALATIAVRGGAAAALNIGGNLMAGPMGWIAFEGAAAAAAINAISDTPTTPVTIMVG